MTTAAASADSHDVVIVGGGVAGATLACVLARAGLDVHVLERQDRYRDRVMGEAMAPWGVVEAQAIGVADVLIDHGALLDRVYEFHEDTDASEAVRKPTELRGVVPGVDGVLGIGNPSLTTMMISLAEAHGATVTWSAHVRQVAAPSVQYEVDGVGSATSGRLIVAADGKSSGVRRQLGVEFDTAGPRSMCAGMLADGFGPGVPLDAVSTVGGHGRSSVVFPQEKGRARLYHMFDGDAPNPYRGPGREERFLADFASSNMPWADDVARATVAGPCATYPIFDGWASALWSDGVLFIGDAAGFSNPLCAQGLAVCMRDVRLVSEAILGSDSWGEALFAGYISDRELRMSRLRTFARFFTLATVPSGAVSADVQERIRGRAATESAVAELFSPIHVGPYLAPPRVFDIPHIEETIGVPLPATTP